MICVGCNPLGVKQLRRGDTYRFICGDCCPHECGMWSLAPVFVGYIAGFQNWACLWCGAVRLREALST